METKICIKCGTEKELVNGFNKDPRNKSGYRQPCKTCRIRYSPMSDVRKADFLRMRLWYKDHPEARKERSYEYDLKTKYKKTFEQFAFESASQNHKCLICSRTASEADPKRKKLCNDHNHKTNENRGLICSRCNSGLGFFQDSVNVLQAAIMYLKSFQGKEI